MDKCSRRYQLRSATHAEHAALEDVVGAIDSLYGYMSYVRGLLSFRAPLERHIASSAWPPAFGDWRPTSIAAALHSDLSDLRLAAAPEVSINLSNDAAGILGACYVLEGSSLGAKILSKHATRLGLTAEYGARHLSAQVLSLESWRAFLHLLENESTGIELDRIVAAAKSTFGAAQFAMRRSMNQLVAAD
jgi:heme oxygenase (biliverdin-IX-beta and delta-forming)